MSSDRRLPLSIKRWRTKNAMPKCQMALAICAAQRRFRRLKGHKNIPALVAALCKTVTVGKSSQAA